MQAAPPTAPTPMERLTKLLVNDLCDQVAGCYVSTDLKQEMRFILQRLQGLAQVRKMGLFHGDIKPSNCLWDGKVCVLADFGGARKISDMTKLMNPEFRLEGEAERDRLKPLVDALVRNSPLQDPSKELMKKLRKWKILSKSRQFGLVGATELRIENLEKLRALQKHLQTSFLPASSPGYACKRYLTAISDFFWRCDADNFGRAAMTFDMRCLGLTFAIELTSDNPPQNETDKSYYDQLEEKMNKIGVKAEVSRSIRRMAEPLPVFDLNSKQMYPLHLLEESSKLEASLNKA